MAVEPISFSVFGNCESRKAHKQRAFIGKDGRAYSQAYHEKNSKEQTWKDRIYFEALKHKPNELWDFPIIVFVTFVRVKPKSKSKKELWPDTKPDLDNMFKIVGDACENVIYTNDSRIVCKVSSKMFGETPHLKITIMPAPRPYEVVYQINRMLNEINEINQGEIENDK
jgi:Holliday junction resolvase RusA-like endonuclease